MSNAAALSFDDLIPPASAGSALAPGGKAAPVSFDDLIPPPAVGATVWNAIKGAQSVSSTPVSAGPQGVAATMDQVEGNNEPSAGIGDVAHRADNLARLAANGVTLGGADRLAAMVLGSGKDVERAKSAQAASEAGPVGVLASMSGAALPTGLLAKGVGAAAGAAEGIPALGALFARPVAQAAATGAGVGAGDALGTDQNVGRGAALGAAAGFGGQAVGNAIGAAGSRLGSLFGDAPAIPTSQELRTAASNAYRASEDAGVVLTPDATSRLDQAVRAHMADFGYDPSLQPGGAAVLNALDRTAGENATLKGIDGIRRVAGQMGNPMYPSAGALGSGVKGVVDDFTNNLRPGDVLMGDQQGGVNALNQARQLYQRSSKDADLSDALDTANLRAGSTGSGGNINNATRQAARGVLQSRNDWTPDEEAALRGVITGTPVGNALRQVGKLSPESGGLMMSMDTLFPMAGHAANGFGGAMAGAGVPLAGFIAKRAADGMTDRAVSNLGDLIRSGGDATALRGIPNAVQQAMQRVPDPIMQAILAGRTAEQRP